MLSYLPSSSKRLNPQTPRATCLDPTKLLGSFGVMRWSFSNIVRCIYVYLMVRFGICLLFFTYLIIQPHKPHVKVGPHLSLYIYIFRNLPSNYTSNVRIDMGFASRRVYLGRRMFSCPARRRQRRFWATKKGGLRRDI